ncbi:MAG: DNA alkylation repair protein [bacterium]
MKRGENSVIKELKLLKNEEKAIILKRFFKTGKGEYGEGGVFWGIQVPLLKRIAATHINDGLDAVEKLLGSEVHEVRFTALQILVNKYEKTPSERDDVYKIYLRNTKRINNWDLVDCSCYKIAGEHLLKRKRNILYSLAKSENLWERRISIVSTFRFIQNREHEDTLKISELLLEDKHDLMHKAVGWMLREVGKRVGQDKEELFLKKHYKKMPRTMLRYSIEHFPKELKKFYMKK